MASGTQNLTSYKARYLAGGIAEVQQHLNITGTAYFSTGTSETVGKSILAYNGSNLNFGIRYFKSTPDVLTISASGNNNSKTDADFSINGLGNGILSHLGNYIPHTGNTTGTVGDDSRPVYVNAGTITQVNTPSSGAWFTGVPQVRSDGVMEIGKYIDWHHEDTTTKDYSVRMTAGDGTLTISGTTYGTFNGSLTGNATTASALAAYASIGSSTTDHGVALKNWFTDNKSTAPRNQVISFYSSTSGNGSQYMGYFLSGYADNPYGGFFVCHYDNPYYVGISNGIFTQHNLVTCDHTQNFTGNKSWGTNGAGGILYGNATNGGINSMRIGDDVYLGDCNAAGIMGMKSTSTNCGFYFYNSSGTQTGQLYNNGSEMICNKTYHSSGGYLKSTLNGNTVQIGSQNTGFCHITNTADIPFWFNKDIYIERGKTIGASGTIYRPFQIYLGRSSTADSKALNSNNPLIEFANNDRSQYGQIIYTDFNNQGGTDSFTFVSNQSDLRIYAPKVYNAVWNDYAETRATDITEPGRVITENGKIMTLANERLLPGCRIISDTYGTCMGREEDTPVAVSGRVLVYPYHNRNDYPLGAAVCSAPNGTVDIMTREEIINYPERIIGTVSEIPDYEYWGAGQDGKLQIAVNNRIWIYVR